MTATAFLTYLLHYVFARLIYDQLLRRPERLILVALVAALLLFSRAYRRRRR